MFQRDIKPWIPLGILSVAVMVIFYRLVIGEVLFWGLPSLQYYPWRQYAFNEVLQGRLPYWNPYVGGGAPLMANYQSALLYPPNWLYLVVRNAQVMTILTFAHILWAGLGTWLFTKQLGFSRLGSSVSMLCYALGGFVIIQAGAMTFFDTVAWLPWLFWAIFGVLDKRQLRFVGWLGLFSGIQLLAGDLQISWYSYISIGLFALWYILFPLKPLGRGEQIAALTLSVIGILIGAGIASGQLIITAELLFQSRRAGGVDFTTLTVESYPPWQLLTLISPNLFGSPVDGSYLIEPPPDTYTINILYIGFLPLVSMGSAVAGWWRRRNLISNMGVFQTVPFWIGLSLLGIALSLGNYTPIYKFLYDYVPTFDNFRGPARWLLLPAFGLSILAGIGMNTWQTNTQFRRQVRLAGLIIIAGLISLGIFITVVGIGSDIQQPFLISIGLLIVQILLSMVLVFSRPTVPVEGFGRWQVFLLIFIAIDLGWAAYGKTPTVNQSFYDRELSISSTQGRLYWQEDYEENTKLDRFFDLGDYRFAQDRWAAIRTSLLPNLNMLDRVETFNNFDPLQPSIHRQYVELIEDNEQNLDGILAAAVIGEWFGTERPADWQGELNQYVAPKEPQRLWIVTDVSWFESRDKAEAILSDPDWHPSQGVVIHQDLDVRGYEPYPQLTEASIEVLYERPNERRYRISSNGSGYLVIPTTWYPGWEARINGDETRVYRANIAFQAIEIPEGDYEVILEYAPTGIGVGYITSIFFIFFAISVIGFDFFQDNDA